MDTVVYCGVCVYSGCLCVKISLMCTMKYTLDLWVWVGQGTSWI